jgi:hypothetical protein
MDALLCAAAATTTDEMAAARLAAIDSGGIGGPLDTRLEHLVEGDGTAGAFLLGGVTAVLRHPHPARLALRLSRIRHLHTERTGP